MLRERRQAQKDEPGGAHFSAHGDTERGSAGAGPGEAGWGVRVYRGRFQFCKMAALWDWWHDTVNARNTGPGPLKMAELANFMGCVFCHKRTLKEKAATSDSKGIDAPAQGSRAVHTAPETSAVLSREDLPCGAGS